MNFDGQYLTHNEYQLLGSSLDIMPFNLLEYQARKIIDGRTQNRLKCKCCNVPQEVKMCVNAMINCLSTYIKNENYNANVSSENIDGYSINYITSAQIQEAVKSKSSELENIMFDYLLPTGLLYLGVN